ncbi:MAG: hypothetical protein GC208_10470 [Alphaproteobacteria bacterium]|nr:hypothetical protein [Alphaproteobacteria bacterium]
MPLRSLSGDSERNWEVTLPEVSLGRLLSAPDIARPDWAQLATIFLRSGICFDVVEHHPARQSIWPWLAVEESMEARVTWRTSRAVWQSTLKGSCPVAWRVSVSWMVLLTLGIPDPEPFIHEVVNRTLYPPR